MSILTKLRERFPVLTPPDVRAEARVAIAEDVIKTLAIGRMQAIRSTYFKLTDWNQDSEKSFEVSALSVRGRGKTRCNVCAIGAAVVCAVGLYDEAPELEEFWPDDEHFYNSRHSVDDDTMRDVLARWFTRQQLDLVECAFERATEFGSGGSSVSARYKAEAFGDRYADDQERLEAIMNNIIRNKGSFRP